MLKTQILLIDNYDSFTFNLVDCFTKMHCQVNVYRNSVPLEFIIDKIDAFSGPKCIVLSPGPGNPSQAGICLDLIRALHSQIPFLGICLGHQSIAQAFGAQILFDKTPYHGKSSIIEHCQHPLFSELPKRLNVGRYHSLYVDHLPRTLKAIAYHQKMIMAIAHQQFPVYGIQFHPESILSPFGETILKNFIDMVHSFYIKGDNK